MAERVAQSAGNRLLPLLRMAWRTDCPPLQITTDQLATIAPAVLSTGLGALVWRRLAGSVPQIVSISELAAAYKQHALEAAVHEIQVSDIFRRIRAMGAEPILFKGWALARLYPEAGLRSFGDIDLWLPSDQIERVHGAFQANGYPAYCVELHTSFYPQYERSLAEVIEWSRLVEVDGVPIRIPSPEDHLRFICLHFLYHGAWRPLWLCDVALMVESRADDFDWDRCLAGNKKYADWIACVIGLTRELLGADISGTPVESRADSLPSWLRPAVLRQWDEGAGMSFAESLSFSFPRRLVKPAALMRACRQHWRNPIQASVEMNAWFSESPRSFWQFGSVFWRIPEFARSFGREIRRT